MWGLVCLAPAIGAGQEGDRAAVGFDPPQSPAPSSDEFEVLLTYLQWQRAQVVATANGLSDEQMRWTPKDRLLPIIGIINHLTHMEWRWIEGRYLGLPFPPRDQEFLVRSDVRAADVIDSYWLQAQRTDGIVRDAPSLTSPCLGDEGGRGPAHLLLGFDRAVDLRWAVLHLVEETAHHAGHADSTREMLDGLRMRA